MQQGKLTACFMVPTMINTVVNLPGARGATYSGLRTILYGAAPMPPALLREAMDVFGCDFINAFGAGTEAGLQTVLTAADHRRAAAGEGHLLGSIGRAAFGVDLRICDPDLNDVPRGEVGEIVTRSDTVMSGYLRNPEATADSLKDGWFRAGDLAFMDEEGYLYLAGRRKDMIIRGGENVYPIEIETVLAEHAAILDVAIVGIPEPHWGEVVRACLVARPGHSTPSAQELADHCRSHLARYKVPEQYVWMDELPRNASGKVLKRELRLQSDRPGVRSL
jgi:fatty-acyl-CoA synthase